jgi:hypothetical protein
MKTKNTQNQIQFNKDDLELIDYLKANFRSRRDLKARSLENFLGLKKYFKPILDAAFPVPRKKRQVINNGDSP